MNTITKHTLFFFLFSFIILNANSQSNYNDIRDSIKKYSTSNIKKAIVFTSKYINKAQQKHDKEQEFQAYHSLQQLHAQNQLHQKSIETCNLMLKFAEDNNLDDELFKAYFYKSVAIYKINNAMDIDIIDNLTKALKIARDKKNKYWQCKFLSEIAEFYNYSKEYLKAKQNLKEALVLYNTIDNLDHYKDYGFEGVNLIKIYRDLTQVYINEKHIDSALYFSDKLRPFLNTNDYKNKIITFTYYTDRADINLLDKKPKLAEKHVDSAYNIEGLQLPYKGLSVFIKPYYKGKIAFQKKQYSDVIKVLKAIPNSHLKQREEENRSFYDYYKLIAQSYMYLGDYKKADTYFEKHLKSIDNQIIYGDSIQQKFKEVETKAYYTEIENVKSEKRKQKLWIISLLIVFFGVVSGLLFFIKQQNSKNKQKFNLLLNKLESLEKDKNKSSTNKKVQQSVKGTEVDRILKALIKFEQKELFLSTNCTLASTAKKLKTNTTYLSKVINSEHQKSFNTYITELRINYAVKRLKEDPVFRKYSILAIANEVGYKSKEGFNKAFKLATGILPSYFIKQISKET